MKWQIFYDDSSTFSDRDGEPHEAPALGVQVIAIDNPLVGVYLLHGEPYYYWENGCWEQCDLFGLWDYLCRPDPYKVVRFGRNMTTPEYRQVFERASNDPDFPRKSAFLKGERRP